jgi:ATP-dependent exoDNAse (exonuclease V) beta subunit
MSLPLSFKHEMLVANAGSGKTYALTTRIIRLLLAGVAMDQIAALTFTRKSAGEFLDELLIRLAEAADDPKKLQALAEATNTPGLTSAHCCQLLKHIIDHFGRLGLSTIDSFFARIARQFPLESGLPEEFAIADRASLASARERALARSFSLGAEGDGLTAMIEQCRQISRKNGERNVFGMLLDQIETLHQRYLETPPGCTWGDAASIWAGTTPPFHHAPEPGAAIDAFEQVAHATNPDLSEEALAYLEENLDALRALGPGQAWSKEVKKFIEQKLSSTPKSGHLQLTRKKAGWLELTPEVEHVRKALADALFADVLQQLLERAQGLYRFVEQYESVYSELVRGAGLISFADITTLLAERASDGTTLDALDWRTQVAYRIDQYFDHWLLDEFQDTSRTQWTILKTFIDEVIMDDGAQRSFFYVGDTKQAIYSWRGGDAELFREIYDYYDNIQQASPLTDSWRSTEPVIEMVNTVFGSIEAVAADLKLPEATIARWEAGWNTHTVAEPIRGRPGYAAWHPAAQDADDDTPAQHAEVRRIIENVDPLGRGIECAVLLRQNKDAAELAAYLQSAGIAVAIEGKSNPCTDNPLGSAVLAALRAAAHPGDSLSAAIARGLPCAEAWGLDDMDSFRDQTLGSIAERGYAPTLQSWIDQALKQSLTTPDETFLQSRGEILLATAENFDASNDASGGIDAFIAAVEAAEIQEAEATEAIRIMTVHQAKGLGFDMVIVSGLDKSARSNTADELVLGPDGKHPRWGMLLPRKDIAEADPVLREQTERLDAESKTNELCGAYVALTRAKRALYVVSDELKENSSAGHFGRHLQLSLGDGWSRGDAQWYS